MNSVLTIIILAVITGIAGAQERTPQLLTVVPEIDLARYIGTWHEIVRLPNGFQKKCISDVTATYSLNDDGTLKVVNRCRLENGEMSEAEGVAKRSGDDAPNSKLKVRFAPAFLSFLPFVWGNYWIIALAPDYSYAVIGEPDRKYLWILSRTPVMEESTLEGILAQTGKSGYDLSEIVRTKNTVQ